MTHRQTSTAQMIPLVTPKMMRTIKLEELSLSRAPHEWGAKCTGSNHHGTHHGLYHHTVHAGKHYKALIDSGAAISLLQYSTYQHIEDSFRTPKQPTTTKLNTANGSPMTALGITALQLRIADFKFTHNFVICNRLPDMEIIFGIDIQKSLCFHTLGTRKRTVIYKGMVNFLIYTRKCEQNATIGTVKSSLKIPPRYNGVITIKIT